MLGRVFLARVNSPAETFDPVVHAREDLTVFSASFSQSRREAGIIDIECLYPSGGFISSNRWAILSVEVDGAPVEVARGQIVGFPLALSGQLVHVQVICRRPGHVEEVDQLFATRDAEVPPELEDKDMLRRAENYLLDELYHDPRTLDPQLVPIAGDAPPVLTLYGEGAAVGQSQVLSISADITDSVAVKSVVDVQLDFEQLLFGKFNAAASLANLPPDDRTTFTPLSLIDGVKNVGLDGGYELLSAEAETTQLLPLTIFTEARSVDPNTCIVTRAKSVTMTEHRIENLEMDVLARAVQPRRETFRVSVSPRLLPFGGEADASEVLYLTDAEKRAGTVQVLSYAPRPGSVAQFVRRGVAGSVFTSAGSYRATMNDVVDALVRRAARTAIERAHCVQLTIETTAEAALGLTLKDRVKLYDARLPAGVATGRVVGLELHFGQSDSAKIVLSCPVSDSDGVDVATLVYSGYSVLPGFVVDTTDVLEAVRSGDASRLVVSFGLTENGQVQRQQIGQTTETSVIADPENACPKTGISLTLRDLSPVDVEDLEETFIEFAPVELVLPDGIKL